MLASTHASSQVRRAFREPNRLSYEESWLVARHPLYPEIEL